jgi:RNA polymerase sigma-70 factor (ECF subfamily)
MELMRLTQRGDQAAYASLLVLLTSIARRFARSRVGAVAWVDDVVQETLLAIHGARHTYDPGRPFAPWFYAIASSRLIDVIRRERRVASRELTGSALPEDRSGAGPADEAFDAEAIRAAVEALPARQRDVVKALKFRDFSVREVAGQMGMSESSVKVTAHRGYRALKRILGMENREN